MRWSDLRIGKTVFGGEPVQVVGWLSFLKFRAWAELAGWRVDDEDKVYRG